MNRGSIIIAGLGPGSELMMSADVRNAILSADAVVGYSGYLQGIGSLIPEGTLRVESGMTQEVRRAEEAFRLAHEGMRVVVVSSGDAGIYGMAPLVMEMYSQGDHSGIEVMVLPGVSAFQVAAARLGAPISHDFCVISLSDLMTPWETIEKRIRAAASADFVTAVYNPRSRERYWQIHRFRQLFLQERSPSTPVAIVRNAGREDEKMTVTTLSCFNPDDLDMFCVMLVGNSSTFLSGDHMITPRGYFSRDERRPAEKIGQSIMTDSFRAIRGLLKRDDHPPDRLWAVLHAIHTTADFEFEDLLYATPGAIQHWHERLQAGDADIVTDVTMVQAGLRKAALQRYGIRVHCYLGDPRVEATAAKEGVTRSQAGIRLAAEELPDALFVIGNAPTALMEIAALLHGGRFSPMGVIGAPVGFVNVVESKLRLKAAAGKTPFALIDGRKGGSTVAATIVNAALSLDDVYDMKPGRDV